MNFLIMKKLNNTVKVKVIILSITLMIGCFLFDLSVLFSFLINLKWDPDLI